MSKRCLTRRINRSEWAGWACSPTPSVVLAAVLASRCVIPTATTCVEMARSPAPGPPWRTMSGNPAAPIPRAAGGCHEGGASGRPPHLEREADRSAAGGQHEGVPAEFGPLQYGLADVERHVRAGDPGSGGHTRSPSSSASVASRRPVGCLGPEDSGPRMRRNGATVSASGGPGLLA